MNQKPSLTDHIIKLESGPLSPKSKAVEPLSDPRSIENPQSVTFPLRWRLYSLLYFLMIGTSVALFAGPILILTVLFLFVNEVPEAWTWIHFYLVPGLFFLWFGYRMVRDFRSKITFTSSGITLRTLHAYRIFKWDQIQFITLLPDIIAVQFPTTAVALRPTPAQSEQFLALGRRYLSDQKTITEAQVLHDYWSRPKGTIAWVFLYGVFGLLVGWLMPITYLTYSRLSILLFVGYFVGYLVLGGLRGSALSRRVILTTKGVINVTRHTPPLATTYPLATSQQKERHTAYIPWSDVTQFALYYDHMVIKSTQGQLQITGLYEEKRARFKDQILSQIVTDPSQWSLTQVPMQHIPKQIRVRVGPVRRYRVLQYQAIIGVKKTTNDLQ